MNLNQYIDLMLIDEHADKTVPGYELDVDDLSDHDRSNFLDELMLHDDSVREFVLNHMQKLIDRRLPEREAQDRLNDGFSLKHLSNGDTMLERIRGNV